MKTMNFDDEGNTTVEQSGPPVPHDEWRETQDKLAKEEAEAAATKAKKGAAARAHADHATHATAKK